MLSWLKSVPNTALYCLTIVVLAVVASVTILSFRSGNTDNLFRLLSLIWNGGSLVLGGGSLLYASKSAQSASIAEGRLNGSLDQRIKDAVQSALDERSKTNTEVNTNVS